jgi:hypothetical protein
MDARVKPGHDLFTSSTITRLARECRDQVIHDAFALLHGRKMGPLLRTARAHHTFI